MSGDTRSITALLPIMGAVLIALVIGLALPVLPLHVHQGFGLSTFVVGLVTGSQFAASLISRVWAGRFSDVRGAKRAVVMGLLTAVISGLLYVASLAFVGAPIEEIHPEDVVWFPPGEKHWHGATPTTAMTHIAVQEKLDGKNVDWLEKVSDGQYRREGSERSSQ
jgi:MFS family permease